MLHKDILQILAFGLRYKIINRHLNRVVKKGEEQNNFMFLENSIIDQVVLRDYSIFMLY